jgi:hypothetical protein
MGDNIELSKYHYASNIKFDISAPFNNITFFEPKTFAINSYSIDNSVIGLNTVLPLVSVLPTTLNKFQWIDYSRYFITSGDNTPKLILTNRKANDYNYDEQIALSILEESDIAGL